MDQGYIISTNYLLLNGCKDYVLKKPAYFIKRALKNISAIYLFQIDCFHFVIKGLSVDI